MKIYKSVTIDMESLEIVDEISYDYDGPLAECKGGMQTTTVTSPEAEQALSAVMPALQRIGEKGSTGSPLYDIPSTAGARGQIGSIWGNAMPSAANIGSIDPNIKAAVAAPFDQAMGQIVEKYGGQGVMGSAAGGMSGVGAKVLQNSAKEMIPQYTQALWGMVQPQAMASAQQQSQLVGQEWGADVAARQAPYGPITQIAGGTMPNPLASNSKK